MAVKAQATISLAEVDDGKPGTAGSKDVPMTYVQTVQPTDTPVKGSIWWVGASLSTVTAIKRWDGSQWVPDMIAQSVLNIKTLNSVEINTATLNSTTVKTTYTNVANTVGDYGTKFNGTGTLAGPELVFDSMTNESTPQSVRTSVAPEGFSAYAGTKAFGYFSAFGQMSLGDANGTVGSLDASGLKSMNITGSELWSGSSWPTDKTTLTPSVPLDECLNGWALLWSGYNGTAAVNAGFCYTLISKRFVSLFSGKGLSCIVSDTSNISTKYVYVTNTTIKGYATNNTDLHAKFALRGIYAW